MVSTSILLIESKYIGIMLSLMVTGLCKCICWAGIEVIRHDRNVFIACSPCSSDKQYTRSQLLGSCAVPGHNAKEKTPMYEMPP